MWCEWKVWWDEDKYRFGERWRVWWINSGYWSGGKLEKEGCSGREEVWRNMGGLKEKGCNDCGLGQMGGKVVVCEGRGGSMEDGDIR